MLRKHLLTLLLIAPLASCAQTPVEKAKQDVEQQNALCTQQKPAAQPCVDELMLRYENLISLWIARYKIYPEKAYLLSVQGDAVLRIRIDRQGAIKYYNFQQKTGSPLLDSAAIDMIKHANPLPPVPSTYPEGDLFEFLIPVNFHLHHQ